MKHTNFADRSALYCIYISTKISLKWSSKYLRKKNTNDSITCPYYQIYVKDIQLSRYLAKALLSYLPAFCHMVHTCARKRG